MSKYTTEVRYICENAAELTDSVGYNSLDEILTMAAPVIFSFDFPIFNEEYRLPLEKKILKHYYTSEIGLETVGLWKMFLDARMNEIMPYYNQLYESELVEYNPLSDVNVTTRHTLTGTGTKTGSVDSTGKDTSVITSQRDDAGTDTLTKEGTSNMTGEGTSSVEKTGKDTSVTSGKGTDTSTTEGENSQETKAVTDRDTTQTDKGESSTENSGKNSSESLDAYTDTPQGSLENLEAKKYITNARKVEDSASNSGTGKETSSQSSVFADDSTVTTTGSGKDKTTVTGATTSEQTLERGSSATDKGSTTKHEYQTTTGKDTKSTAFQSRENQTLEKGHSLTDKSETKDETKQEFEESISGKRNSMSYGKMMQEWRESFLNIDRMIIDDLSDLFMSLW